MAGVDSQSASRAFLGAWRLAVRARNKAFTRLAADAFAQVGRRATIELPLRLHGERRIAIGDDVAIGPGSWLQVLDEPGGDELAIEIGDGCNLAGGVILSAAVGIRLGRRVLFARNVYVADHSHRYDDVTRAVLDQGIVGVEPIVIEDGAWLGENVIVCPGVRIGRGAVVGGNAVVTRDVPDWSLAVGAPARVVRSWAPAGSDPATSDADRTVADPPGAGAVESD